LEKTEFPQKSLAMKATCLYSFDGKAKGQLGFQFNDQLLLIREDTGMPGWGLARSVLNQEGFVPLSYLSYTRASNPEPSRKSPRVTTIEKGTAALLEWVQGRIPEYHVVNFASSWRDGRALMALCNALRPGTFDLPSQFRQPEENAAIAIETAEHLLEIPATVSAGEIGDPFLAPERLELYVSAFMAKQRQLLDEADAEERRRRRQGGLHKVCASKSSNFFFKKKTTRWLEQSLTRVMCGAMWFQSLESIIRAFLLMV
jgi:hypothetical protein